MVAAWYDDILLSNYDDSKYAGVRLEGLIAITAGKVKNVETKLLEINPY